MTGPAEGPRARLVIKSLVLENFKSYAGRVHIGPFHKSFSAIVGPNGSGKSNVIDAMLFVFGKKAKQLRLSKVSELIHNSVKHRNLELASVTVFFEEIIEHDEDRCESVPGSELSVTRTAQRNNSSQYFIDDKKSSFTEVTTLLKGKGVDLNNNRFLILQGEVEQISLMKAKGEGKDDTGLLEYLEDIIGTDQYVAPIEAAAKELEELTEERQAHVARVQRAEADRDQLADACAEARAYREKEIAHTRNYVVLCLSGAITCADNVDKAMQNVGKATDRLEHEERKLEAHATALSKVAAERASKDKARAKAVKAADAASKQLKEQECTQASVGERDKHLQKRIAAAATALANKQAKHAEQQAVVTAAQRQLPDHEARVPELQKQLASAEEELDGFKRSIWDEVVEIQGRLSEARTVLAPWSEQIAAERAARDEATTELQVLTSQANADAKRLAMSEDELAATLERNGSHAQRVAALRSQVQQRTAAAQAADNAAADAISAGEAAAATAGEARTQLGLARSTADAEGQRSAALKALVQAQARGQLLGVHGRLGDLAAVDEQYDAAVSNAASGLNHVVVDTVAQAQACLAFLRAHKLGVASFLILEKQQHQREKAARPVDTPHGCERLFDLIKCDDDRFVPALFWSVGNTFVARDLQHARSVAYGSRNGRGVRVATLQGELIQDTGIMVGGGTHVVRGRMRLGDAPPATRDAAALRADADAAAVRLRDAEAILLAAQREAAKQKAAGDAARRSAAAAQLQLQKAEMEAASDATKAQELQRQLADLRQRAQAVDKHEGAIGALQARVAAKEAELMRLEADAASAQTAVAVLQQELDSAGGAEMRAKRDAVAELKQEVQSTMKEVARLKAVLAAAAKTDKALSAECAKRQREHDALAADLGVLRARTEDAGAQQEALAAEVARTGAAAASATDDFDALHEQHASKTSDVAKIQQVVANLTDELAAQCALQAEEAAKAATYEEKAAVLAENFAKLVRETQGDEVAAADVATREEVQAMGQDAIERLTFEQTRLDGEIKQAAKTVDTSALAAYAKRDAEYKARRAAFDSATAARDAVRMRHDELRARRLEEFMAGFGAISAKLKEMYQMITLGGDAELELVDTLDPFSEGIVFSVRPPKKSWKNIGNLSGGEKTLSSLSLVFALHHVKPTPLYFMDEIDAALDFKNVSIVAHYVKEQTRNAQFVVISLRNNMFELADHLVGICKPDNCTKTVPLDPNQFVVGSAAGSRGSTRPLLQQQHA